MHEITRYENTINRYRAYIFSLFVLGLIILSFHGTLDEFAHERVAKTTTESIGIYALSRGINGTISVLQSSQVKVPFFASLQIGELLDPINDAVERLSSAMVWAIGSLFLQRIILEVASSSVFKWGFLAFSILAVTITLLAQWDRSRLFLAMVLRALYIDVGQFQNSFVRIFAIVAIVRFVVPAFVAAGFLVSQAFLKPEISENMANLSQMSTEVSEAQKQFLDEQKNEVEIINDQAVQDPTVEEPKGSDSVRSEQKARQQGLSEQKEKMDTELKSFRTSLTLLWQESKELGDSIDKLDDSGLINNWLDRVRGKRNDPPSEEMTAVRAKREELRRGIETTEARIEQTENDLECIDRLIAGKDCDSLLDDASQVVSSAGKATSEALSNVTGAASQALSSAGEVTTRTLSTVTDATSQLVSKISVVGFSRITGLVEKANDMVTSMTRLMVVVIVENIVLPVVFLMIALKGSLPIARGVARMTSTLRQDSRELRAPLGRAE